MLTFAGHTPVERPATVAPILSTFRAAPVTHEQARPRRWPAARSPHAPDCAAHLMDDDASDPDANLYKVDTVPPPLAGEGDAYSARRRGGGGGGGGGGVARWPRMPSSKSFERTREEASDVEQAYATISASFGHSPHALVRRSAEESNGEIVSLWDRDDDDHLEATALSDRMQAALALEKIPAPPRPADAADADRSGEHHASRDAPRTFRFRGRDAENGAPATMGPPRCRERGRSPGRGRGALLAVHNHDDPVRLVRCIRRPAEACSISRRNSSLPWPSSACSPPR